MEEKKITLQDICSLIYSSSSIVNISIGGVEYAFYINELPEEIINLKVYGIYDPYGSPEPYPLIIDLNADDLPSEVWEKFKEKYKEDLTEDYA